MYKHNKKINSKITTTERENKKVREKIRKKRKIRQNKV